MLEAKTGTLVIPSGFTGNLAIGGLGFEPSALLLWTVRSPAAGVQTGVELSLGLATGGSTTVPSGAGELEQVCLAVSKSDGTGLFHFRRHAAGFVAGPIGAVAAGTVRETLRVASFDLNGVTLSVTGSTFGTSPIYQWLILGGCDIQASLQQVVRAGTGTQAVSVGFRPDAILSASVFLSGVAAGTQSSGYRLSTGFATRPDSRQTALGVINRQASDNARTLLRTDRLLALPSQSASGWPLQNSCALSSWDAAGFTLNWQDDFEGGSAFFSWFLCLAGADFRTLSIPLPVANGQHTFSTPFAPLGALLVGAQRHTGGSVQSGSHESGSGKKRLATHGPHQLRVGDAITVTGHSLPSFNATHRVEAVISPTIVRLTGTGSGTGAGGQWSFAQIYGTHSGGTLDVPTGRLKFSFPAAHGLLAGEQFTARGAGNYTVEAVTSATTLRTATPYSSDVTAGDWWRTMAAPSEAPNHPGHWHEHANFSWGVVAPGEAGLIQQCASASGNNVTSGGTRRFDRQTSLSKALSLLNANTASELSAWTTAQLGVSSLTLTAASDNNTYDAYALVFGSGSSSCPATLPKKPTNLVAATQITAAGNQTSIRLTWDEYGKPATGTIQNIVESFGGCGIQTALPHGWDVGDRVIVSGSSVAAYNTEHIVLETLGGTLARTNRPYVGNASGPGISYRLADAPDGYEIQRSKTGGPGWQRVFHGPELLTGEQLDAYMLPGEYFYRVRAYSIAGTSDWSNQASASILFAPGQLADVTGLVATPSAGPFGIDLSWNAATSTVRKRWEVEKSTNGGANWSRVYYSPVNENITSFTDATADRTITNMYRVRHRMHSGVDSHGASWQNQDDPLDVDGNGQVTMQDLRRVVSWLAGRWPDFGPSLDQPTGGPNPALSPPDDPPPAEGKPDINGSDTISAGDGLIFSDWLDEHPWMPAPSAWAEVTVEAPPIFCQALYWVEESPPGGHTGQVWMMWPDGEDAQSISRLPYMTGDPVTICADGQNNRLVWITDDRAEFDTGLGPAFYRSRLDGGAEESGSNPTRIEDATITNAAQAVAVDPRNQDIFWSHFSFDDAIRRYDNSLGSSEHVYGFADGYQPITGLHVDLADEQLWSIEGLPNHRLTKSPLDNPSLTTTVATLFPTVIGADDLTLDDEDGYCFIASSFQQKIWRLNKDGTGLTAILSGQLNVYSLAADTVNKRLYFTEGEWTSQSIKSCAYDGTGVLTHRTGVRYPGGLAFCWQGERPAAPTGLAATVRPDSQVDLSWSISEPDHLATEIFRRPTGGTGWALAGFAASGESFVDNPPAGDWDYRVRSVAATTALTGAGWQRRANPFAVIGREVIGILDHNAVSDWLLDEADPGATPDYPGPPAVRQAGWPYLDVDGDNDIASADLALIAGYLSDPQSHYSSVVSVTDAGGGTTTTTTTPAPYDELELCIAHQTDNGWFGVASGYTNFEMQLGADPDPPASGVFERAYMRYREVPLPPGTVIHEAVLTFRADGNSPPDGSGDPGTIELLIAAEDADSSTLITDFASANTAAGSLTTAAVHWDGLEDWRSGELYQSPDLAAVIQEVIDRAGWAEGNALTLLVLDDYAGVEETEARRVRTARTGDVLCSTGPVLRIAYTAPATTTTTTTPGPTTTSTTTTTPDPLANCRELWVADSGLRLLLGMDYDGGNQQTVLSDFAVRDFAVDITGERIFFVDEDDSHLWSCGLDGAGATVILPATVDESRWGLALDVENRHVYFTQLDSVAATVRRVRWDGAQEEELVDSGAVIPSRLSLDLSGGKMYWGAGSAVRKANLDGSSPALVKSAGSPVLGVAVDAASGHVYYTVYLGDPGGSEIRRVNTDGTGDVLIRAIGVGSIEGLELDLVGEDIYYAVDDMLLRTQLDGSGEATIYWGAAGAETEQARLCPPAVYPATTTTTTPPPPDPGDCHWLWWSDWGQIRIRRAALSGGPAETFRQLDFLADGERPYGVTVDTEGDYVFVATDFGVWRLDLADGGGELKILDGVTLADPQIAYDRTGQKVYTCDGGLGGVWRVNRDGSSPELFVAEGQIGAPRWLAVDDAGRWLFVAAVSDQKIYQYPLSGGARTTVHSGEQPRSVAWHAPLQKLYFTASSPSGQFLRRCDAGGANKQLVYTIPSSAQSSFHLALDTTASQAWWIAPSPKKLWRVDLDGTDLVSPYTEPPLASLTGLSICGTADFTPTTTTSTTTPGPTTTTSTTTPGPTTTSTTPAPPVCPDLAWWTDKSLDILTRAPRDGFGPLEDIVSPTAGRPRGVAVDPDAGLVFYAAEDAGEIWKADLDGASPTLVLGGASQPRDVAVDPISQHVYWADYGTNKIRRANYDGSSPTDVLTGIVGGPQSVEFDQSVPRLFICAENDGTGDGKIIEYDFSTQTNRRTLGSFRAARYHAGQDKLYFVDQLGPSIWRMNTDGTGDQRLLSLPAAQTPDDLALDTRGGRMWWTAPGDLSIWSANLDGSSATRVYPYSSGSGRAPSGIAMCPQDPGTTTTTTTTTPGPSCVEMWWSTGQSLKRASSSGGPATDYPLPFATNALGAVAYDASRDKVYWDLGGDLWRGDADGGGQEIVLSLDNIQAVAFDSFTDQLLVSHYPTTIQPQLSVCGPDGSGVVTYNLPSDPGIDRRIQSIAPHGELDLVFVTYLSREVAKLRLSTAAELAIDDTQVSNYVAVDTDSDEVFVVSGAASTPVYKTDISFSGYTPVHAPVGGTTVWGMGADAAGKWVYTLVHNGNLPQKDQIYRFDYAGTVRELVFSQDKEHVLAGFALGGACLPPGPTTTPPPEGCRYLFFTSPEAGELRAIDSDGSDLTTVLAWPSGTLDEAGPLAVDRAGGKVYWSLPGLGGVQRANLDGSVVEDFVTGLSSPMGLAVYAGRLYVADSAAGAIFSYATSGPLAGQTVASGVPSPVGLSVDPDSGHLYFASGEWIRRVHSSGSFPVVNVFQQSGGLPFGVAVLVGTGRLAFCDLSAGIVRSISLAGASPRTIALAQNQPTSCAWDEIRQEVVWTENGARRIRRADDQAAAAVFTLLTAPAGQTPYWAALCGGLDVTTTTTSTTTTTPGPTTTTTTTTPGPTTTTTPAPTTTTTTTPAPTTTPHPPDPELPGGREQISVDQPQGGLLYPFLRASDDLGLLIGDLHLLYQDPLCSHALPFRIVWLAGFGTEVALSPIGMWPNEYDLLIADASGATVFDSRQADSFRVVPWGETKKVIEWTDTQSRQTLRVVIYAAWAPDQTPRLWDTYFEPAEATLDHRTVDRAGGQLVQLAVQTAGGDVDLPTGRPVALQGGYNLELEALQPTPADGALRVQTLLLSAEPGGGRGRFNDCSQERVLLRLAGVAAGPDGDVKLDAAGCYKLTRIASGQVVSPASLRVSSDCGPCWDCQDFINVYEAIRKLHGQYRALGERAEAVRDLFRQNRKRWESGRDCREGSQLRVALQPLVPCLLHVAAAFCNQSTDPVQNVTVDLDFSGSEADACLLCETVFRRGNVDPSSEEAQDSSVWQPYKLSGVWPNFQANFDCLSPGTMGVVIFKLLFTGTDESQAVLSASATLEGEESPASEAHAQTGLLCSRSDDEQCCADSESLSSSSSVAVSLAGDISSITLRHGHGRCLVTTAASQPPHGLAPGDTVLITGTSVASYNTVHTVQDVGGDRHFSTDIVWVHDVIGGQWEFV